MSLLFIWFIMIYKLLYWQLDPWVLRTTDESFCLLWVSKLNIVVQHVLHWTWLMIEKSWLLLCHWEIMIEKVHDCPNEYWAWSYNANGCQSFVGPTVTWTEGKNDGQEWMRQTWFSVIRCLTLVWPGKWSTLICKIFLFYIKNGRWREVEVWWCCGSISGGNRLKVWQ